MAASTEDLVHHLDPNSPLVYGRSWEWRDPRRGDFFRTCSYCGSIHPEDLAAEAAGSGPCRQCGGASWEACFRSRSLGDDHQFDPGGWWASWADRKYGWPHKFYVQGLVPRDSSMLHCIASSSDAPREDGYMGLTWYQVKSCPRKLIKAAKADGMVHSAENKEGWLGFGPRQTLHAKFYSVHLADPAISAEAKETIARVSGLRFEFDGTRVAWHAYSCDGGHAPEGGKEGT